MHKEMQMLFPPEVIDAIVRYIDMKYAELYGKQPAVKRMNSYAIVDPIAAHSNTDYGTLPHELMTEVKILENDCVCSCEKKR